MTINSERGPKRPYAAPKMVAYGDMASLTRNGTGSQDETGVPLMGMFKKP